MCACQNGRDRHDVEPGSAEDLELNVGECVLFDVNSARVEQEAKEVLDRQAGWLNEYRDIRITIEGHCDARGTREYNLALGAKRANAVRDYLIASGIDASRISTISYGKERPPVEGSGPEVWRENRRAITRIS